MPQTIAVQRVFPWAVLACTVAFSVLTALVAVFAPAYTWFGVTSLIAVWPLFLVVVRRPAPLTIDRDGLLFEGHRVRWDEISSIEPPSARGEIVLRLRRAVPPELAVRNDGEQDWLALAGASYALGPLGTYALLVGASHEASWLLGSADSE
ncbi:MAG: hypothetical protein KDE27_14510 [Planctomycetes bacterium]|nr:hypothetical protein [Planctomycetota bacterium]